MTRLTGPRRVAAIVAICLTPVAVFLVASESSRAKDGRNAPVGESGQASRSVQKNIVRLGGKQFTCPDNSDAEGLLRLARRAMDDDNMEAAGRLISLAEALGARVRSDHPAEPRLSVQTNPQPRAPRLANHAAGVEDQVVETVPPPGPRRSSASVVLGGVSPRIVIQEEEEERLGVVP